MLWGEVWRAPASGGAGPYPAVPGRRADIVAQPLALGCTHLTRTHTIRKEGYFDSCRTRKDRENRIDKRNSTVAQEFHAISHGVADSDAFPDRPGENSGRQAGEHCAVRIQLDSELSDMSESRPRPLIPPKRAGKHPVSKSQPPSPVRASTEPAPSQKKVT